MQALRLAQENLKLRQSVGGPYFSTVISNSLQAIEFAKRVCIQVKELQVSEMPDVEKEQAVGDRENVANEDGQTSESLTNASLHSGGGPPECDDSSDTSLKLG